MYTVHTARCIHVYQNIIIIIYYYNVIALRLFTRTIWTRNSWYLRISWKHLRADGNSNNNNNIIILCYLQVHCIDGPFDDRQLLGIVNIPWCLYVKYYFKGLNIFTVHILSLYLYKSTYYILIILNLPVIEEKSWLLDRWGGERCSNRIFTSDCSLWPTIYSLCIIHQCVGREWSVLNGSALVRTEYYAIWILGF